MAVALYTYIGASYRFDEKEHYYQQNNGSYISNAGNSPISLQLELGVEVTENVKIGWRHDSVLTDGCPFDCSTPEYTREEVFIGFTKRWQM